MGAEAPGGGALAPAPQTRGRGAALPPSPPPAVSAAPRNHVRCPRGRHKRQRWQVAEPNLVIGPAGCPARCAASSLSFPFAEGPGEGSQGRPGLSKRSGFSGGQRGPGAGCGARPGAPSERPRYLAVGDPQVGDPRRTASHPSPAGPRRFNPEAAGQPAKARVGRAEPGAGAWPQRGDLARGRGCCPEKSQRGPPGRKVQRSPVRAVKCKDTPG